MNLKRGMRSHPGRSASTFREVRPHGTLAWTSSPQIGPRGSVSSTIQFLKTSLTRTTRGCNGVVQSLMEKDQPAHLILNPESPSSVYGVPRLCPVTHDVDPFHGQGRIGNLSCHRWSFSGGLPMRLVLHQSQFHLPSIN